MDQAQGIMDIGYFCPRSEILDWINKSLKLSVSKIEQLGSGAVYCQLLDNCFPGHIPMQRVNWKAKNEYDFIQNLKVLQQVFLKLNIQRCIEVERLAKARYADNLEFAQWLKRFCQKNGEQQNYDAISRRGGVAVDFSFADKLVVPKIFNKLNNENKNEVQRERLQSKNKESKSFAVKLPNLANFDGSSKKSKDKDLYKNIYYQIKDIYENIEISEKDKLDQIGLLLINRK